MSETALVFHDATQLAAMLRRRELSAREVVEAHLAQIEQINPQVNAVVTLLAEQALARANAADAALARGELWGPLHGVPVGIKDFHMTAGVRTTFGSPIYAEHVPEVDHLHVARLRRAGAILLGKTNTPEFAAGAQTFNPVFGTTLNPYDPARTCGGSSGGSAVALACGMLPLADGSDLGGSLRNPAAYNNVVGFRTSPGRVPLWPAEPLWEPLFVMGPMGRTVADVALMLSVMAGPDDRAPLSMVEPGAMFAAPLSQDLRGAKVAYAPTLNGFPVDAAVRAVTDEAVATLATLGCAVERAEPDVHDASDLFQTLRAHLFQQWHAAELREHRDRMKDTVIWNTEKGLAQSVEEVGRAETGRAALYERVRAFMEGYDYLVLPVNPVPPIPADMPYPTEINGQPLQTYMDWMLLCFAITLTGLPALSVPCGFTPDGLPCGLQIVGRYRAERAVLALGAAFEAATGYGRQRPGVVA